MLDRHHAELAACELRRERDDECRLARVLDADDGDHACCRHSSSARARSSGVLTLKNSSSGLPKPRTWASERIPTRTSGWKEMAWRSPLSSRCAIAGPHAGPYRAQSGSRPRLPELCGRNASYRPAVAPSTRARSNAAGTKGMSQATHNTGADPAVTAV